MVVSEHLKPTSVERRILEFNWRMGVTAEFNERINKYKEFIEHIKQIRRLGMKENIEDTKKILKKHEDGLREVLKLLQDQNLSAFHDDVGIN